MVKMTLTSQTMDNNSFSNADSAGNYEHDSELENIENRLELQSKKYPDNYFLHYGNIESQLSFDNSNISWPACES